MDQTKLPLPASRQAELDELAEAKRSARQMEGPGRIARQCAGCPTVHDRP